MISVDPLTRRFNSGLNQQLPASTQNSQQPVQQTEQPRSSVELQVAARLQAIESSIAIINADLANVVAKLNKLGSGTNASQNQPQSLNSFDDVATIHRRLGELDLQIQGLRNIPSTDSIDDIVSRVSNLEQQLTKNLDIINKPEEAAPKKPVRRGIKLKSPKSEVEEII